MATLNFTPSSPVAGQTVRLHPFDGDPAPMLPPLFNTWDFGDGSTVQTNYTVLTASHVYTNTGQVPPPRRDLLCLLGRRGPLPVTEFAVVIVPAPLRSSIRPPPQSRITFQPQNFLTPNSIAWDFGDSATVAFGGAIQTHAYMPPPAATSSRPVTRTAAPRP